MSTRNRQPKGQATGGQFATEVKADDEVGSLSPADPTPFSWNGSWDSEQVRPYMRGFLEVHAELEAAGKYPYNDSFKGRIPGLAGSPDEERGIYLCQQLRSVDEMNNQIADWKSNGAIEVACDDLSEGEIIRGDVAEYGFYMGGSGFSVTNEARVAKSSGGLVVLQKGKRNGRRPRSSTILVKKR